jgi:site-specific DNA-methyltransferase (adenine-specific)
VPSGVDHWYVNRVFRGDNLELMRSLPPGCCDLVYVDPPFWLESRSRRAASGAGLAAYLQFLEPRLEQMHRLLAETGSFYCHLDWRAVHYVKVRLDGIFGYGNFLNEVIWSYRTGGVSRRWFGRKHDTILVYAKHRGRHRFRVLREGRFRTEGLKLDEHGKPYKQTRAGRLYFHRDGPLLTDVWDIPFLSTVSMERAGYPSQKPLSLAERIVRASSDVGGLVGDFFCGSGTTLVAAQRLGRRWVGCDVSAKAVGLARRRLAGGGASG